MITQREKSKGVTVQVNTGTASAPVYKKYTFNYISPNAEDEDAFTFGTKISNCIDANLEAIGLIEKCTLVEEA